MLKSKYTIEELFNLRKNKGLIIVIDDHNYIEDIKVYFSENNIDIDIQFDDVNEENFQEVLIYLPNYSDRVILEYHKNGIIKSLGEPGDTFYFLNFEDVFYNNSVEILEENLDKLIKILK